MRFKISWTSPEPQKPKPVKFPDVICWWFDEKHRMMYALASANDLEKAKIAVSATWPIDTKHLVCEDYSDANC